MSSFDASHLLDPNAARQALLSFPGLDFKDTLTIGQIIKGRVLRHFEGGRYLVNFSGHNKLVDSSVPLTTNEIVYGKVVGLGERVELSRIKDAAAESVGGAEAPAVERAGDAEPRAGLAESLFASLQQYQLALSGPDLHELASLAKSAQDVKPLALGATILHKLGLSPMDREMLILLQEALSGQLSRRASSGAGTIDISTAAARRDAGGEGNSAFIAGLSGALKVLADAVSRRKEALLRESAAEESPRLEDAAGRDDGYGDGTRGDAGAERLAIADLLLNAQSGGAVSHRTGRIPLMLDGNMVELEVALFDQHDEDPAQNPRRYRQVVFSLQLDELGPVEINATTVGGHVRIVAITGDAESTERLALHAGGLRQELEAFDWTVDELSYETRLEGPADAVSRTVVEHLIARDSLDRRV
jgi:hypothetical protein